MSASRGVFFCLATFFVFSLVQSTEFVPCLVWSNQRTSDKVPALNKISQDVFKEGIQKHLKDDSVDLIVIFAEQTLSPEDFAQHDQSGVVFSSLAKLSKIAKASYFPYVQNPIKALKHLDVTVTEVPLDKLDKGFEIPETDILIINLNDARDNENRIDMLKRHDSDVSLLYEELTKTHKNVLCIYTAHHTSWVASEEIIQSRQRRSLLEAEEPAPAPENETKPEIKPDTEATPEKSAVLAAKATVTADSINFWNLGQVILYMSNFSYQFDGGDFSATSKDFVIDTSNTVKDVVMVKGTITGQHTLTLTMTFKNLPTSGYWEMQNLVPASITNSSVVQPLNLTSDSPIVVRNLFSFHCGDQIFTGDKFKAVLKDFQIQLNFTNDKPLTNPKFYDAYDCVGFTSVPIWSGLFVTTILLIIMTLGITMMMDIRTMDKFDDAKGKTITINAE